MMAEKKLFTLTLICVMLSTGLIGATIALNLKDTELQVKADQIGELENQKNTLETQVSATQNTTTTLETQVETLQTEKQTLETQVTELQNETGTLQNQTQTLQTQKTDLETQVTNLQTEVATLNSQLLTSQAQVETLQDEVDTLESEVSESYNSGYSAGEADGYDAGYLQAMEYVNETGWYLVDPTYSEAMAFTENDTTDLHPYTPDYVCYDFSADYIANALDAGYRCGFVYIEYATTAHSVVCFNTTDYGLIYIEPQNDAVITLAIGQMYLGEVILDLGIIW